MDRNIGWTAMALAVVFFLLFCFSCGGGGCRPVDIEKPDGSVERYYQPQMPGFTPRKVDRIKVPGGSIVVPKDDKVLPAPAPIVPTKS